jgi:8-oxo-dGTP diphosphatase
MVREGFTAAPPYEPRWIIRETGAMVREWLVAGAVIEQDGGVLLVQNRRRDGHMDWSTPGGVIDEGETLIEGLTREVAEETGIVVTGWRGPLWEVSAEAPEMGWRLRVEVHLATEFDGEIAVNDPDGIVVDAQFVPLGDCRTQLASTWIPTHEPLLAWLDERFDAGRTYSYRVDGASRATMAITRLD